MKKISLFLCLCLIWAGAMAQSDVANAAQIQQFYKTKTMVVIDKGNITMMDYNDNIKEAVEKYWKLTEYEIISTVDFAKKKNDPKLSFLLMTEVTFNIEKTNAKYDFLSLVLGGKASSVVKMPQLCAIPLAYSDIECENYAFKLGTMIKFIQNHVELTKKSPNLDNGNIIKHYNDNLGDLQGKTIYFIKEELAPDVNTEAKIKNTYPGPVKLVSREELATVIKNETPDAVYLHKVGPEGKLDKARCFKLLVGITDAKLYYFDFHMKNKKNPDAFLDSDFKKIAK